MFGVGYAMLLDSSSPGGKYWS